MAGRPGFAERYGPWALVTGAAQGIGRAFAEGVARRGLHPILVDQQSEPLMRLADELHERHGVDARAVVLDLARRDFLELLRARTADAAVGLLVCNAAVGQVGPFLRERPEGLRLAIEVNCIAPALLAHAYGRAMAERGRGGIVFLASGSAFHGSPYVAHYAATKAYNLVLGEGLWYELRRQGVDVLAFVPGPTNTPGLRRSQPRLREGVAVGLVRLPGPTAEAALDALGTGPSATRDLAMRLRFALGARLLGRRRRIEAAGRRLAMLAETPRD
jgi:uncharacterized protein